MVHFFRCPHRGSRLRESAAKQAPCGGRRPLSASLLWLSFLAGPSSAQNTAPSASPTSPAIAAAAQSYVFHQDRRGRITVPVCAQPEPGREPGVLWQPLPESSSWRNLQTDGSHGPRMLLFNFGTSNLAGCRPRPIQEGFLAPRSRAFATRSRWTRRIRWAIAAHRVSPKRVSRLFRTKASCCRGPGQHTTVPSLPKDSISRECGPEA